ncbi:hypothetical protein H257_04861 [Aphanomyces astaci]|uniref:Major facilitator superfamily (MFS) profile domain-containing protein n=2 Tax=Aphanomyces astaci TaxID=112090 RepID=W4GW60_APHAT|nr:hypothetical protein H257_04861 [Aphanomyces astaci]ETV83138.1 hypothetical protein H257_04861 [Aphanomyces astaci]|eukprot:XP_009827809.1 hypothetical protein H257_04861 [Aphanomyces astaci]
MELMTPETTVAERSKHKVTLNVLFSLIGIGYLFPFSALTQPVDYWKFLFPDVNIEFYITCVFLYTNLITLGLVVAFGSTDTATYASRIVGGFGGQFLVLMIVPTAYFVVSSHNAYMAVVLVATAFAAVATAFLDSCVIALAATYPVHAQEALQFGVGLSALIGSVFRVFTKLVFPIDAVVESSAMYFYIGAITVVVCVGAFHMLMRLKRHVEFEPTSSYHAPPIDVALSPMNRWNVLRQCYRQELLVTLSFFTTLCLWPPLVTEMTSFNFPDLQRSGWWPLILLTVFSVMDCIGRVLVPYRFGLTKDTIWKPVVLRMLLIPCIVMTVQRVWFTHDAWSVLFVVLLGLSNGYFGSLTILVVNESVDERDRGVAGTFTGFFLIAGLVLGSTMGLIYMHVTHP